MEHNKDGTQQGWNTTGKQWTIFDGHDGGLLMTGAYAEGMFSKGTFGEGMFGKGTFAEGMFSKGTLCR